MKVEQEAELKANETHLDSIVKNFGCWMKHEVLHRRDFRGLPSSQASVISDLQHVIGEVFSENEIVCFRLWVKLVWSC